MYPLYMSGYQMVFLNDIKANGADIHFFDNFLEEFVEIFGYGTLRNNNSCFIQKRFEIQCFDRGDLYQDLIHNNPTPFLA